MTTRELEKLRKKMPSGWNTLLWKRLNNHSFSAIYRVLNGDYNNDEIIDAALELAEEHQAHIKARKDKLDSL